MFCVGMVFLFSPVLLSSLLWRNLKEGKAYFWLMVEIIVHYHGKVNSSWVLEVAGNVISIVKKVSNECAQPASSPLWNPGPMSRE